LRSRLANPYRLLKMALLRFLGSLRLCVN
jgi:hypothetical protein